MNNAQDRIGSVLSGAKQHTSIFADCFDVFPMIPDHSIDMIFADLPYGETAEAWDRILPMQEVWRAFQRTIKPEGAMVFTATQPFSSLLVSTNLKQFKHEWVWNKVHGKGFQIAKYRPLQQHEHILVFSTKTANYFPIMTPYAKPRKVGGKLTSKTSPIKYSDGVLRERSERYPTSILTFSNAVQVGKIHSTEKPIDLLEYLIRTYTPEGAVVLDPTAGGLGITLAAINTNRRSIVIENNAEYYAKGVARVKAHMAERQSNGGS